MIDCALNGALVWIIRRTRYGGANQRTILRRTQNRIGFGQAAVDSPLEGGGCEPLVPLRCCRQFEGTPVHFFWPELSAKKRTHFVIADRRCEILFLIKLRVAGWVILGESRRSPPINTLKAHELLAEGWRATDIGACCMRRTAASNWAADVEAVTAALAENYSAQGREAAPGPPPKRL